MKLSRYLITICVLYIIAGSALLGCRDGATDREIPYTGTPQPDQQTAASQPELIATTPPSTYLPVVIGDGTGGTPEAGVLDVSLTVQETSGLTCTGEPVTSGVPVPRSVNLTDLSAVRLLDGDGRPVPTQFSPLARWGGAPDDVGAPVQWLLLDFQADVSAGGVTPYRLVETGGVMPQYPTLTVSESLEAIIIDTGVAQFSLSKVDGRLTGPHLSAPISGRAIASDGNSYTTTGLVTVEVTMSGPMRISILVKGAYRDAGGSELLDYSSRYWFYAGLSQVRLFHTVENNTLCPLAEYGQLDCYDIGSGGSVSVADLSLVLPADLGGALTYETAGGASTINGVLTADFLLLQDSSGTDHWDHYPTLVDWDANPSDTRPRMQSYVTFRGYRTSLGAAIVDSGDQAAGWLAVTGDQASWSVGVVDFRQNFPKALRAASDGTLEIGLFPGEFGPSGYAFSLRAGEHKTHEILLDSSATSPLSLSPLQAVAPPHWVIASRALGLSALPDIVGWPDYEEYVEYQLDTSPDYEAWMDWYPNLPAALESTDFYGIFDYGDWPIDYEGFGVSPFNSKYENDYGMWQQWSRGGDHRWFQLAQAAGRHFADIDILHNLHNPRHWGDGIAFGHSYHDEEGFLNPHRNYGGNHPDTAFGMRGMLLTYYLTGYEKAFESALELADSIEYRTHHDENLCSVFPDCNGEGYRLGYGMYEAGCRPAANNLSILVAAYRATADPRYLAVAEALVEWADAADQPYINGPTGADQMMRPWMLNLYLRALASYLDMRQEFGLPDSHDAAASYLAYANWLRTYALIDLPPVDTGPRAAYPYEWWFDGRQGDLNDEWAVGNNIPSVNNWLLLGADALAYAYRLSGEVEYLDQASRLFRAGSRDPFFEGDANTYSATKETVNGIAFGHTFLHEWSAR